MKKKAILFVCHGNICRSPMAEYRMKDLLRRAGLEDLFTVDSAAVSDEETGNPVYPPASRKLREKGIDCPPRRAKKITPGDYGRYDLILGMDRGNLYRMLRVFGGDPGGKVKLLLEFTARPRDVADPWYTGDFEAAWRDIDEGCRALFEALTESRRTEGQP